MILKTWDFVKKNLHMGHVEKEKKKEYSCRVSYLNIRSFEFNNIIMYESVTHNVYVIYL